MAFLSTTQERKSAIITSFILILLLYVVFNYGMKYLDPPIEYGIAVNFGNSNVGSGEPVKNTKDIKQPNPAKEQHQEILEKQTKNTFKDNAENIITDNNSKEAPIVKKTEKKTEIPVKTKKQSKPAPPKPSKTTTDALNSLLKGNSSEGSPKGEGDDKNPGIKGKNNGDPNVNKYYGNARSGNEGNYNLAGRKAISKPIRKPNCEEEGTVVVSIFVNKNGEVIKAIPGAKGTTNTAPCLLKAAKDAAMITKWNTDKKAPNKQKGTIIYKFSLSK